jgi:hypothetical protein
MSFALEERSEMKGPDWPDLHDHVASSLDVACRSIRSHVRAVMTIAVVTVWVFVLFSDVVARWEVSETAGTIVNYDGLITPRSGQMEITVESCAELGVTATANGYFGIMAIAIEYFNTVYASPDPRAFAYIQYAEPEDAGNWKLRVVATGGKMHLSGWGYWLEPNFDASWRSPNQGLPGVGWMTYWPLATMQGGLNWHWGRYPSNTDESGRNVVSAEEGATNARGIPGAVARIGKSAIRKIKAVFQGHHPIPKYLGGKVNQWFSIIHKNIHREFHENLAKNLKEAFEKLGLRTPSTSNGSAANWARFMKANPGSQRHAFDTLLSTSRATDAKYGTNITQ